MSVLRLLCAAVALTFAVASLASAQERHALVVGINAYENLDPLQKAVNDGRSMAASLEQAGFTVDAGFDLTRRDFVRLLAQFLGRLQPDDEALVFYAGHAVAIENRNFLVPSDASALEQSSEALIIAESIGQDFLLEQITATGVRLTVVIMDACRNNPFEGLSTRSLGRDAGLAITQPPRGVFVMYSADEGQTALDRLSNDDPHPNSVFTRTLLPLIEEPGLDIVDIARRLRGDVQALAAGVQHQQFPVYRDRMQGGGQFVITPARNPVPSPAPATPATVPAAQPAAPPAAPPVAANPCVAARADWALLGDTPSVAVLQAFRAAHADCPLMMTLASDRLAALITLPRPTPQPVPQAPQVTAPRPVDPPAGGSPVRGGGVVDWAPRFGGDRISYWDHNGSGMAWESLGTQRWVWYYRPRSGIAAQGVTPGTLLFSGTLVGGQLSGQARRFSRRCGTLEYYVSGTAVGNSVTLQGSYPTRDDACRNGYQQNDRLNFTYVSTLP